MDFSLNDAQEATQTLARRILADIVTVPRQRELEAAGDWFDHKAWRALADAGLLGIAAPEEFGGAGLGFLEVALVLEEIGRTAAKVPYLASVVLGILPIAEFADAELRAAWLPRLVDGTAVATTALLDDDAAPATARADANQWVLTGTKVCVPAGLDASLLLVPAMNASGTIEVFAIASTANGVTIERQDTTTGVPEARIVFDGAPAVGVLAPRSGTASVAAWIGERAAAALAATAVGVCDAALRITAEYTKTREQFGRAIATFQAVGQRAADAYIDTEAIRLTALQAAWRINEDLPAAAEVAIAKFWAADGGARVVHAAQHLHGGMGVDRDYPLHRYFLLARHIELTLGGATAQLLKLGDILASS